MICNWIKHANIKSPNTRGTEQNLWIPFDFYVSQPLLHQEKAFFFYLTLFKLIC